LLLSSGSPHNLDGQRRFGARSVDSIAGLPLEFWFPIALFTAAGIYRVQLSLRALPDTTRLTDFGLFPTSLVIVLVVALLLIAAFGGGLGTIGWLIYRAYRSLSG